MARFEITHTQISGSRSLALSAGDGLYKDAERLRKAAVLLRGQSGFGVSEVQSLITRAASNTMRHAGNAEMTAAFLFDLESVVTHRENNALRIMQGATVEDYTAGYSFAGVNWPVPSANLPIINIPGVYITKDIKSIIADWISGVIDNTKDKIDLADVLTADKYKTKFALLSLFLGGVENFLEHREFNDRFFKETATEFLVDLALQKLIEVAVTKIGTAIVGGAIVSAKVVVVIAVATVIFIAVDKVVEHFTDRNISEHISDFIWDDFAKEAAGNASNSVKDAFNTITNCFNNPQNNIIPKWAPAMAA